MTVSEGSLVHDKALHIHHWYKLQELQLSGLM